MPTAAAANNAMAGNDDGNGIAANSAAHSLTGHGFLAHSLGHYFGDAAVGQIFSMRDFTQNLPNALPKFAAYRSQRQIRNRWFFSGEITVQPLLGIEKYRQVR